MPKQKSLSVREKLKVITRVQQDESQARECPVILLS